MQRFQSGNYELTMFKKFKMAIPDLSFSDGTWV